MWSVAIQLILTLAAFTNVQAQPASEEIIRQRLVGLHLQGEQAREIGRLLGNPFSINYGGTTETLTLANNVYLKVLNASGVANNTFKIDSSNNALYNTPGGEHRFYSNGTLLAYLDDNTPNLFFSGAENTSAHIFVSTADGADFMSISMAAAGEQGVDRSGLVTCYGNEFTTSSRQGECRVIGGNVAGGDVTMETHNAEADVILSTLGGNWSVDATDGNLESNTTSAGIVFKSPDGTCSLCTVDNSDVLACSSVSC